MLTTKYLLLHGPTTRHFNSSTTRHFNSSTALPQRSASKFAAVCARVGYATKRASGAQGAHGGTAGLWPRLLLSLLRRQRAREGGRDQKEPLSLIGLGEEGLLELFVRRAFARHACQTLLRLLQQLLLYAVRASHYIRSLLHYDRPLLTLHQASFPQGFALHHYQTPCRRQSEEGEEHRQVAGAFSATLVAHIGLCVYRARLLVCPLCTH
jgi:hypothetical protein